MNNTIYIDTHYSDEVRRAALYAGQIFVHLRSPSVLQFSRKLRELQHHHKPSRMERWAYKIWRMALCRPWLYRWGLWAARLLLRRKAKDGWLSQLPGPGANWTLIRDFPAPAAQSFRDRWKEMQS